MRAIGTTLWVSAVLLELQACGPRVSVGDLGATAGGRAGAGTEAGSSALGGSSQSQGGTPAVTDGGKQAVGGSESGGGTVASAGGTVVAEGGAEQGSGGAAEPDCPAALDRFLPPVEIECPDAVPESGAACDDVAENGICVWQTGLPQQSSLSGYEVRGCYSALGGKKWYGIAQDDLGPPGVDPKHCPWAVPEQGSSCVGHANENCYYPEASCTCANQPASWKCTENPKPQRVPASVERLCPPANVDESLQIKDLDGLQIDAWCRWYAGGGPRPEMNGSDTPGYADAYPAFYGHIGGEVCIVDLPLDWCMKNIMLFGSECTATLAQLDDCVESIRGWANATPAWVGHGCGPLLSNPGCERTIVQKLAPPDAPGATPPCKVPVAQDSP
jgi:hypothetical protein